jgi:2'-5' RNA ligase
VDDVAPEIAIVARSTAPFAFVARRTKVISDTTRHHVFLVPDEGATEITMLHDRFYSGVLKPHLRTDIPFIPHLTVAVAPDSTTALRLAKEVDTEARVLRGIIDTLELLDLRGVRVQSVATHKLT